MLIKIKFKWERLQTIKNIYKEIFDKVVTEKFNEIRELTNGKSLDYLTYYFNGDTSKQRFDDYNNCIEFFKKIQADKIKLVEAKKNKNRSNKTDLNKISKEIFKSEAQKMTLKYIKLLYESRDAVMK